MKRPQIEAEVIMRRVYRSELTRRMSVQAGRVIEDATRLADSLDHQAVGTAHVIRAMAYPTEHGAIPFGVDQFRFLAELRVAYTTRGGSVEPGMHFPEPTYDLLKAFHAAADLASSDPVIDRSHLILGICSKPCTAVKILRKLGGDPVTDCHAAATVLQAQRVEWEGAEPAKAVES